MENKYFTPDIEDLHIGYECEEHTPYSTDEWSKVIIEDFGSESDFDLQRCRDFIFMDKIRVPYLTKEQIEAEGWKFIKKHPGTECCDFEMGKYYLDVDFDFRENIHLRIYDGEYENEFNYFSGKCKDINTLRKIIKLLGI